MSDEVMGLVQAPLKHAGDILSAWGHDPERAVLGINNPAESAIWGAVLGKDYTPDVNMLGGATELQKADMANSGINMGLAKPTYAIADAIAGAMGGAGAAGGLGAAAGAGGEAGGAVGGTLGEGAAVEGGGSGAAIGEAGSGAVGTSGGEVAGNAAAKTITGSAMGDAALKAGVTTAAQAAISKAMAPKAPKPGEPIEMPDPLAVEQARKQSMLDQIARRGRASTIMTGTSGGRSKLGG